MIERFFVPTTKLNSKVAQLVIPGKHIVIGGITYEELSGKPRGRSIKFRMSKEDKETSEKHRLIIYS